MQAPQAPQQRQVKIEKDKDLHSNYSNMVMISHTGQEFIFDFLQMIPQDARAYVVDRVFMNPVHAKLFLNALQDNLNKYEARFGEIPVPKAPPTLADQLFQNIAGGENNEQPE